MKIITGRTGSPHVTSADDRALYNAIWGKSGILCSDGAKIVDATTVRILPCDILLQGCHARILPGEYEDLSLSSGNSGLKRIDLIVAHYEVDSDGYEDVSLKLLKGTPSESNPVYPEYVIGDVSAGATVADMPLYSIRIDGYSISEPVQECASLACIDNLVTDVIHIKDESVNNYKTLNERVDNVQNIASSAASSAASAANDARTSQLAVEAISSKIDTIESTADSAAEMAVLNDASIKKTMKVATAGRIINKATRYKFTFTPGENGVAIGSTSEKSFDVPPGTSVVVGIIASISHGLTFGQYEYSIKENVCTFKVSAANTSDSTGTIEMVVLGIGTASSLV